MKMLPYQTVKDKIIHVREQDVMLDYSVAELYGVETREINQAVKNNPKKFPKGYVFELDRQEVTDLRSKNLIATSSKSRVNPKAFTEKGLYMLATILKGDRATETTIAIIEAYAKLRELSRTIGELSANPDKFAQKSLMQKSGAQFCRVEIEAHYKAEARRVNFMITISDFLKDGLSPCKRPSFTL